MTRRAHKSPKAIERERDLWLAGEFASDAPFHEFPSSLEILSRDPSTGMTKVRGHRGDVVEMVVHKIAPDPKLFIRCHPVFPGEKLMIEFQLEYDRAEDGEPMLEAFDTEKEAVARLNQLYLQGYTVSDTVKMYRVHRIEMLPKG